jgi:hypothetical protein
MGQVTLTTKNKEHILDYFRPPHFPVWKVLRTTGFLDIMADKKERGGGSGGRISFWSFRPTKTKRGS